ncbi:MAG: hypothetical protein GWN71_10035, partial [Gammaproteobacteria bacterium]|nr:hypothetical protein [Gammaproteobacteria bacterium]NIX20541.1 hypothetical protein [Actinomycetota bacterium]
MLDAVTTRETAQIVDGDGLQREEAIEPLTNYGVARVVKDFNDGRSAIGGIFTSAHRSLAPALDFLRSQAYTAGIDARHRLA